MYYFKSATDRNEALFENSALKNYLEYIERNKNKAAETIIKKEDPKLEPSHTLMTVAELAKEINKNNDFVFYTGAGLSASAGVPN